MTTQSPDQSSPRALAQEACPYVERKRTCLCDPLCSCGYGRHAAVHIPPMGSEEDKPYHHLFQSPDQSPSQSEAALNTDKEIWRRKEGDYYSPSIHVTEQGAIGINVGGTVIVKPIEDWHKSASLSQSPAPSKEIEEQ